MTTTARRPRPRPPGASRDGETYWFVAVRSRDAAGGSILNFATDKLFMRLFVQPHPGVRLVTQPAVRDWSTCPRHQGLRKETSMAVVEVRSVEEIPSSWSSNIESKCPLSVDPRAAFHPSGAGQFDRVGAALCHRVRHTERVAIRALRPPSPARPTWCNRCSTPLPRLNLSRVKLASCSSPLRPQ